MSQHYNFGARFFHWLMVPLILTLIIVGFTMGDITNPDTKQQIYTIHMSFGAVALILVTLRINWRLRHTPPALPGSISTLFRKLARATHYLLYLCMFAMPISGAGMTLAAGYSISFFNLFKIPGLAEKQPEISKLLYQVHTNGVRIFIALIVLHLMAALYHHFWRKDEVLIRMLRSERK